MRPHRSGIEINDEEILELGELIALSTPKDQGRRLLVLNVCDAGGAPNMEGSFGLGVAPAVAQPEQAVISHLWPVKPFAAAAFGAFLATSLASQSDYGVAFASALRSMRGGQATIVKRLDTINQAVLAERVRLNDIGWDSVFNWGSPVYVS